MGHRTSFSAQDDGERLLMPFFSFEDAVDGLMILPYRYWAAVGLMRAWVATETRRLPGSGTPFTDGYRQGLQAAAADFEATILEIRQRDLGNRKLIARVTRSLQDDWDSARLTTIYQGDKARGFKAGYEAVISATPFICRI